MKKLLISILGQDRPGILAATSSVIVKQGGNIENISQTLLQSIFGALIIVSVPERLTRNLLEHALAGCSADFDLHVHIDNYFDRPVKTMDAATEPYIITALGSDQQGLVAKVTNCLLPFNINVSNLQAVFKGGSKPLDNIMIFEVDIPRDVEMTKLRGVLNTLSEKLSLDINIQHRKIFKTVSRIKK